MYATTISICILFNNSKYFILIIINYYFLFILAQYNAARVLVSNKNVIVIDFLIELNFLENEPLINAYAYHF